MVPYITIIECMLYLGNGGMALKIYEFFHAHFHERTLR